MRKFTVSEREIFVDHQKNHRSGHMGHAMVNCGGGRILDFYSSCDYDRAKGHSGYGWMEYRISSDYGRSFSEARVLPYSKKLYEEGVHTALCEKAVKAPDGSVLLFIQITDTLEPICCEPWSEPTMAVSWDNGETFSDGIDIGADKGRIYDAVCDDKYVYFIMESNEHFLGTRPEHVYKVYKGTSDGHFTASVLPIDAMGKGYGALEFAANGDLIAYAYDSKRESEPEYTISHDGGLTWDAPARAKTEKLIRNPQLRRVDDIWFLVGRNGGNGEGLVLYASEDGIHWDEGRMLDKRPEGSTGTGYYSNLLPIWEDGQPPRVLLQYSHVYDQCRVNIAHRMITVE